jgi:hypothetical protein
MYLELDRSIDGDDERSRLNRLVIVTMGWRVQNFVEMMACWNLREAWPNQLDVYDLVVCREKPAGSYRQLNIIRKDLKSIKQGIYCQL